MYLGLFLDFCCRSTWSGYLWTVSYCLSLGGFTKLAFISVLLRPAPSAPLALILYVTASVRNSSCSTQVTF